MIKLEKTQFEPENIIIRKIMNYQKLCVKKKKPIKLDFMRENFTAEPRFYKFTRFSKKFAAN